MVNANGLVAQILFGVEDSFCKFPLLTERGLTILISVTK
jgi:hypothetical protein